MELEKKNVWNVTGNQVVIVNDNASATVTQNNGVKKNDELEEITKTILDNISALQQEDADKIKNVVGKAKKELNAPNPENGKLKDCIKSIAPMFTIANGIPVLLSNLQKLCDYILSQIH